MSTEKFKVCVCGKENLERHQLRFIFAKNGRYDRNVILLASFMTSTLSHAYLTVFLMHVCFSQKMLNSISKSIPRYLYGECTWFSGLHDHVKCFMIHSHFYMSVRNVVI